MMIPGRTLHRLAARICNPRTLEHVVEPAIADLQKEWAAGATTVARRTAILISGYCAIGKVIAICALSATSSSSDERRALMRTLECSVALIIAATVLLMLPPLSIIEHRNVSSIFLAALIPQAAVLAIPIGLTFGVAVGLSGVASCATRKVVLLLALALSLASCATLVWVMPPANLSYRDSVAKGAGIAGPPMKGPTEMSLSELRRAASIAAAAGNGTLAARYAWNLHLRFALGAATAVLAMFLLTAGGTGRRSRGILAFVACFAYWALVYVGESLSVSRTVVPAFAGAWLPNIVFAASAVLIVSSRSSWLRGLLSSTR